MRLPKPAGCEPTISDSNPSVKKPVPDPIPPSVEEPPSVAPAAVVPALDAPVEPPPVVALVDWLAVALDPPRGVDPDESPVVVDEDTPGPGGAPPELAHAKASRTGIVNSPRNGGRIRTFGEGGIEGGNLGRKWGTALAPPLVALCSMGVRQKAKSVSDGIAAALEPLSTNGDATHMGLVRWLEILERELAPGEARERIRVALDIARTGSSANPIARATLGDPLRSRPIGFYAWDEQLSRAFVRDRFLQHPLPAPEAQAIDAVLRQNSTLGESYARHLRRIAQLTDRLARPALGQQRNHLVDDHDVEPPCCLQAKRSRIAMAGVCISSRPCEAASSI